MSEIFRVGVRFQDWASYEDVKRQKAQVNREMARRKAMRLRIAKKFKQFPSWQDTYHVYFYDAPLALGRQIKAYLKGKVMEAEVVRVHRADIIPPQVRRRMKTAWSGVQAPAAAPARRRIDKPIKARPAVMSTAAVRAFLRGKGTIVCDDGARLRVAHRVRTGANDAAIAKAEKSLGRPLTPSHKRLLGITDGCALFADATTKSDSGLIVYSLKQLIRENRDKEPDTLLVGEPTGFGNAVAVNYTKRSKLGEPPIVYVDHEGGDRDGKVVADSFEDLLRKLKADPMRVFRTALDGSIAYGNARSGPLTPVTYKPG
jgi:hypothetical protein